MKNIKTDRKNYSPVTSTSNPLSTECREFLTNKLLSNETIEAFKVRSSANDVIRFRYYEKIEDKHHLTFVKNLPINDSDISEKELYDAGTKPILHGMHLKGKMNASTLILAQSELDAMTIYQSTHGNYTVCSAPLGKTGEWIDTTWDFTAQFEKIIIWAENNVKGKVFLHDAAYSLTRKKCWMIMTDYQNATQMLREEYDVCFTETDDHQQSLALAHAQINELIINAHEYQVATIVDAGLYEEPVVTSTKGRMLTGFEKLDRATCGWKPGDHIMIFGKEGSGKSTVAALSICEALRAGGSVMIYSGEQPVRNTINWINLQLAGPDHIENVIDPFSGASVPTVKPEAVEILRKWYRGRLFIYDVFGQLDVDAYLDHAEYVRKRFNVSLFVTDSITTAIDPYEKDRYAMQGSICYKFQTFAQEHNCVMISLAHTTQESRRVDAPPKISDIRGAGEMSDSLTHALAVWRVSDDVKFREPTEKKSNPFYQVDSVIVLQKNKELGRLVSILGHFDYGSKRIIPMTVEPGLGKSFSDKYLRKVYCEQLDTLTRYQIPTSNQSSNIGHY